MRSPMYAVATGAAGAVLLAVSLALGIYSFLPALGAVLILGAVGVIVRSRRGEPPASRRGRR